MVSNEIDYLADRLLDFELMTGIDFTAEMRITCENIYTKV
jgi:hypothetical protein